MLLFVSYAREDSNLVGALSGRLRALGHDVWVDTSLHGGQEWWAAIVDRIQACDVFLPMVSRKSLRSVACQRELQWAAVLRKPILPVAVEAIFEGLPRELANRQIVDYSRPGEDAAYALAAALMSMPPAPALPDPLPPSPAAPLSYLTDLTEQIDQPLDGLTHTEQRAILDSLQPALRSADVEEQAGATELLARFRTRGDLYADVHERAQTLASSAPTVPSPAEKPAQHSAESSTRPTDAGHGAPASTQPRPPAHSAPRYAAQPPPTQAHPAQPVPPVQQQYRPPAQAGVPYPTRTPPFPPPKKRSSLKLWLILGGVLLGLFVLLVGCLALIGESSCYDQYGNYVC